MDDERRDETRMEEDESRHDDEVGTERPHRTGGQAEGARDEDDDEKPIERSRPSQAEG